MIQKIELCQNKVIKRQKSDQHSLNLPVCLPFLKFNSQSVNQFTDSSKQP